jgi:HK97 family phage major capsid protein
MTTAELKAMIKDTIGEVRSEMWDEIVRKNEEANAKAGRTIADVIRADMQAEKDSFKGETRGLAAAQIVRAMAVAGGNRETAAQVLKGWKADKAYKALTSETAAGGGALIAPEIAMEIIEALTPKTVVRALGAQSLPLKGSYSQPMEGTGTTAYYVGETQNRTPSDVAFEMLNLTEKEMAVIVPIPNRLRELASVNVDRFVLRNMLKNIRIKEDQTFLRSPGGQYAPKGMLYWCAAANKFNANTTVNFANVLADLGKAVSLVEDGDVPMERCGWAMRPSTKWKLMTLTDSNGNMPFFQEMLNGTLLTFPYKTTTSIPKNIGNGSQTEVYFADFGSLLIGENEGVQVDVSDGAAYWNGSTVVSGFSTNQTVMRAIFRHDFSPTFGGKEIAIINSASWTL